MGSGRSQTRRLLAVITTALVVGGLWLVLAETSGGAATVPLSISISGNHFVNGAGQTIRLLGVDHASSEYACAEGWGYNDGHQNDADAAAVAAWHADAVRIPLNEDCWLGANSQPNSSETGGGTTLTQAGYQQAIVSYVNALNAHGIYAILDLHWTAPGSQVALEQQPMPDADHSPDFWQSVAATFKNNPAVVFDVFNEPYDPTDPRSGDDRNASDAVTWGCWATGTKPDPIGGGAPPIPCDTQAYDENGNATSRYQIAGMQSLVAAIRSAGATQPIMVGGLNYSNDLSQWAANAPNDPLNQEAASFHNYMGQACSDVTCWNSTVAPVAAAVPVVTGEFDEDDYQNSTCANHSASTFDSDYMTWADQHGVSYLAWGWEVLTADEISSQGCSAYFLTSDPSGTPAAPNGTSLHDHLAALAAAATSTTTTTTPTETTQTVAAVALKQFIAKVLPGGRMVNFKLVATQSCSAVLTGLTVNAFAAAGKKKHRSPVAIGSVRFTLVGGKAKVVALKLSAKARGLLASRHSLKVRMTITLTAAGSRSVVHRNITLKLPPHKRRG
jgi:hypothetical protein